MSEKPGRRKAPARHGRGRAVLAAAVGLAVILVAVFVGLRVIGGDDDGDRAAKDPLPQVPSATALADGELATQDMEIVSCPSGTGTLTATGNVINHGEKAADYAVTVAWFDKDGSVLQTETGTVPAVAPGATTRWMLRGEVSEAAASCAARLTRGSLAA